MNVNDQKNETREIKSTAAKQKPCNDVSFDNFPRDAVSP